MIIRNSTVPISARKPKILSLVLYCDSSNNAIQAKIALSSILREMGYKGKMFKIDIKDKC